MLFKFCKLMRRKEQQQQDKSFVGRLSRSLSKIGGNIRRSKSASSTAINKINIAMPNNDNISNCSSIELVRQQPQSRASSSLMGQLGGAKVEEKQQQTQSFLTMCDNNNTDLLLMAGEQEVPTAAPPALASMGDFEFPTCDITEFEERLLAERRVNYAKRNMRRNALKAKHQETEWMFKLYDLPGSENEKNDMSDVAKSIRKTLVSSLTPLLVETTSQLRHVVQNNSNQQPNASAGSNNSAPGALHLHITMKRELLAPSQQSASPQQEFNGAVSPNSGDAVCVVRVSATISSNEAPSSSSSSSAAAVVPHEEDSSPVSTSPDNMPKKYFKSLQQIDDVMLQSMPSELLDNGGLMKRTKHRRHRTQKLIDSAVQTKPSSMFDDQDVSPVFFQQQILMRHEKRQQVPKMQPQMGVKSVGQRSLTRQTIQQNAADLRRARVVPLNQPQQHFYHYQQDDLFSETSVVGTYEERACSIAKCLNWMSKISSDDEEVSGGSPVAKNNNNKPSAKHRHHPHQPTSSFALGAGEALAVPPSHVYHHIHHHKHFIV